MKPDYIAPPGESRDTNGMSSAPVIPLSEYLETIYRPDRDYIDGEVLERNLGEREHAALQGILARIFGNNRKAWGVITLPEQRVQVSGSNYRVADLCVVEATAPRDRIVRQPPLIAIEILSRRDTMQSVRKRGNDYLKMGVKHFWIFDPVDQWALVATNAGLIEPENGELIVPGTPIKLVLSEIWAERTALTKDFCRFLRKIGHDEPCPRPAY
jgi:Uma2 family endonuclease